MSPSPVLSPHSRGAAKSVESPFVADHDGDGALAQSAPTRNAFSKLVWRQCTGGLRHMHRRYSGMQARDQGKVAPRSLASRFYDACPSRLCIPFRDILDGGGKISSGCVVLGFSRVHGLIISYSCVAVLPFSAPTGAGAAAPTFTAEPDSTTYSYTLQLWHFRPHKRLCLAGEIGLFRCRDIRSQLLISVTECEGGSRVVVHGAESTAVPSTYRDERRQCHVTIVDISSLIDGSPLPAVDSAVPCLHLVFALPDRYAYVPAISARIPDAFIMNTGDGVSVFFWRRYSSRLSTGDAMERRGETHHTNAKGVGDTDSKVISSQMGTPCVHTRCRLFGEDGQETERDNGNANHPHAQTTSGFCGMSSMHASGACKVREVRMDAEQFLSHALAREGKYSPVDYDVRLVDMTADGHLLVLVIVQVRVRCDDDVDILTLSGIPDRARFRIAWLLDMDTHLNTAKDMAESPDSSVDLDGDDDKQRGCDSVHTVRRWQPVACERLDRESWRDIQADLRRMGLVGMPRAPWSTPVTMTNIAVLRGQSLDHFIHPSQPIAVVFHVANSVSGSP